MLEPAVSLEDRRHRRMGHIRPILGLAQHPKIVATAVVVVKGRFADCALHPCLRLRKVAQTVVLASTHSGQSHLQGTAQLDSCARHPQVWRHVAAVCSQTHIHLCCHPHHRIYGAHCYDCGASASRRRSRCRCHPLRRHTSHAGHAPQCDASGAACEPPTTYSHHPYRLCPAVVRASLRQHYDADLGH